jgi:glycerol-3-phosphate dehydrogenase
MAQETVDTAIQTLNLKPIHQHSQTEHVPILGGEGYSPTLYIKLIQRFGFERLVAEHLARSYGDRAFEVARLAEPTEGNSRILGRRIVPSLPYIEAEIRYACRFEMARTAIDVIARRTRLAFLNANQAADAIHTVVDIMGLELKWDPERKKKEAKAAKEFLKTMGVVSGDDSVRAAFSPLDIVKYRRIFNEIDADKSGFLSLDEVRTAFDKSGEGISSSELHKIMIGLAQNGNEIHFDQFLDVIAKAHQGKSAREMEKFEHLLDKVGRKIEIERSGGGL